MNKAVFNYGTFNPTPREIAIKNHVPIGSCNVKDFLIDYGKKEGLETFIDVLFYGLRNNSVFSRLRNDLIDIFGNLAKTDILWHNDTNVPSYSLGDMKHTFTLEMKETNISFFTIYIKAYEDTNLLPVVCFIYFDNGFLRAYIPISSNFINPTTQKILHSNTDFPINIQICSGIDGNLIEDVFSFNSLESLQKMSKEIQFEYHAQLIQKELKRVFGRHKQIFKMKFTGLSMT